AWAPSWWSEPLYQRPGSPTSLNSASRGEVNIPHDRVPQIPARPWAEVAPTGSSMTFSIANTPTTTMTPAIAPMLGAGQSSTSPDGAVSAPSPAIAPLPAIPMSIVLVINHIVPTAATTPAAAARLVTTTTSAKRPPIAPSVEPGLNPNQPSQRIR